MRILGLDYGSKTVGVAITDGLGLSAQPLETIEREHETKLRRTLARISEIVTEYEVSEIVLGFPINMSGTVGERAQKTLAFKEQLEKRVALPVFMQDERLTTIEADETLELCGIKKENRKKYIDQIAAVLILREYMEKKQSQKGAENGGDKT